MSEIQPPATSSNRWIVGLVVVGVAAGMAWVNPVGDTSLTGQATGEHLTNQPSYDRDALWEVCMAEGDKNVSDCILETACNNWEDGTLSLAASQSGKVSGSKVIQISTTTAAIRSACRIQNPKNETHQTTVSVTPKPKRTGAVTTRKTTKPA